MNISNHLNCFFTVKKMKVENTMGKGIIFTVRTEQTTSISYINSLKINKYE